MENISISESFEMYRLDFIIMSHQAKKTEEAYMNAGTLLTRFTGDKRISDLSFEDVRDWHNYLLSYQKPGSARNNIICVRNVLKYLALRRYEVLNYASIPVPQKPKRTIKYLTYEEVQAFINEANRRVRGYSTHNRLRNIAIIELLFATGLRNSELCSLDRDSIRNRSFTIAGKSKEPRIVFINTVAEMAINKYLDVRSDNNKALFVSGQNGKRITPKGLRLLFSNICKRSKRFEELHPHTMRHSHATFMLERDVDLRYIGDLMGHQDLNTTKMYTHYVNKKLREVYEKAQILA